MRVNVAAVLRGCSDREERAVGVVPQRQARIPAKNSKLDVFSLRRAPNSDPKMLIPPVE